MPNFELVNTQKHGFDAKKSHHENIYLEVKQASLSAKSWRMTFNDTSEEKAEAFMDKKMFLALSVVLIYQTIVKSSCHYTKW